MNIFLIYKDRKLNQHIIIFNEGYGRYVEVEHGYKDHYITAEQETFYTVFKSVIIGLFGNFAKAEFSQLNNGIVTTTVH